MKMETPSIEEIDNDVDMAIRKKSLAKVLTRYDVYVFSKVGLTIMLLWSF